MRFGILGNGSWGTALAKILTDNGQTISWWNRSAQAIEYIRERHHNPQYLSTARFEIDKLQLSTNAAEVISNSDCVIIAIPSAYAAEVLRNLDKDIFSEKKIISAIKGILPEHNVLLNDYLKENFSVPLENYFAVLGPCHAEEVAAEKLSYLTFSGVDKKMTHSLAGYFKTDYLNTVENNDIYGVQFAAVLKNIYAVGAGIAHGLDYGDNFLSVLIANSADEMAGFLRKAGIKNIQVGSIEHDQNNPDSQLTLSGVEGQTPNPKPQTSTPGHPTNYAASVYLGDLLVTCYSLHSRNRSFGNMIGKGYSVKNAQLEMTMVAEGYNASNCMFQINKNVHAEMPIANTIYDILWKGNSARESFQILEASLI